MEKDDIGSLEGYKEIAISIFIIVVGFYLVSNILPNFTIEANENWGPIGDFIGGLLNPIFSLIALFALLATIKLQIKELNSTNIQLKNSQEELNLTREEVGLTRKATEESSKALIEQSNSIKIQNFENTFFNMLNLHNEIINNIKIKDNEWRERQDAPSSYSKKEAISFFLNKIDVAAQGDIAKFRKFNIIYDYHHDEYQDILGHYFGNIYQILKFVSINKHIKDKRKYSDLFRAQFSSNELELLFYHCTGKIGSRKFKKYLKKFEFLEHLVVKERNHNFKFILATSIFHKKTFGKNNKIANMIETSKKELNSKKVTYEKLEKNKKLENSMHLLPYVKILCDLKKYEEALEILEKAKYNTEEENKKSEYNPFAPLSQKEKTIDIMIEDIKKELD